MLKGREKRYNDLMNEVDHFAEQWATQETIVVPDKQKFSSQLGQIQSAPTPEAWVSAVKAALEALAAKLFGSGDRPKWTKIAGSIVDIAAFVVAMIRSLKSLKK